MQRDIWLGNPKAALRTRRQEHVDKITVFVDSESACGPVWVKKNTSGLMAQLGNHNVKSGSTLQSWTALSVGEVEFYAVVKGGQVGLSLRSKYIGLRIPMKVEKLSDSSTGNSLTDRLGAGPRTRHMDTRERVGVVIHQDSGSCSTLPFLDFDTTGSGRTNRRITNTRSP